ncbi:MAG: signal transduction histidine kinase [Flavobacterium sp.]|jgi:signal transduction histidine kinase
MIAPKFPTNETARQKAVDTYARPTKLSKEIYDNITSLVAIICKIPYAVISILDQDRNEFYSSYGMKINNTSRAKSFCGHTILSEEEITIVYDAAVDERFLDNPFVTNSIVKFYAGVPIVTQEGYKLGTLCVYDTVIRNLSDEQIQALKLLAKQVMTLFESDRKNRILSELQLLLERKNSDLEKFAVVVSHDLKSPLANVVSLTNLLEEENKENFNDDSRNYIDLIKLSAKSLNNYIEGILIFYKSEGLTAENRTKVNLLDFIKEIKGSISVNSQVSIGINSSLDFLQLNKAALQQIFLNLISNSVKYNRSDKPQIKIKVTEDSKFYYFEVEDNGIGIEEKYHKSIFQLFQTANIRDNQENMGSGIGLATVKKLIENLGGKIKLNSTINKGTTFYFTLLK